MYYFWRFLAAEESVKIETKMQNLGKGLFSGAGLFVVKASGTGTLFFNSFGAIYPLELQVGEEMVVDTGHLVAWDADMNYKGNESKFRDHVQPDFR